MRIDIDDVTFNKMLKMSRQDLYKFIHSIADNESNDKLDFDEVCENVPLTGAEAEAEATVKLGV